MSTPPQYPPLTALASIEDMERRAVEILPKHAVGYWGGSAEEQTLARNRQAFKRFLIRQYILRDVSRLDTSVHLKLATKMEQQENGYKSMPFDRTMPFPLGIAPTAFQRMAHSDGEKATVRAAGNTGTIMICSSFSNFSLEEIAANAPDGTVLWFQVSMCQDLRVTESLARRAIAAGIQAFVVTPDPITEGRIRNNVRNGFVLPYHLKVPNFEEFMPKQGDKDDARHNSFALIADSVQWETVEWLVRWSPIPVVLKGVIRPEDAERAIQAGVSGIIVSNLGGRSLDHAPSTIEALAEISATIRDRIPLFMDGGIRSGTDIFKALALGAQTVFIGRPALYGLAVAGEDGVKHVIELLRREFENAMRLAGCSTIAEIRANRQMVVQESYYSKF